MFNIFICKGLYHTDTGKCVLETCIDIPDLTSVFHKSCLHSGILLKGKPKHNNNKDDQWKCQFLIDKEKKADKIPYSGGEFRSKDFYGYGKYEVSMKPIKNDGVVSSFFTYTGPSDNNPWDEIDIEFLGKDTTKVQFNYYRDGKGGHEYLYDLGFDASESFHTYGFEWHKDKIIWFVDGKEVYRLEGTTIPVTKAKLMMNAWCGTGVDEWLNAFDDKNLPVKAEYQWIKYTPFTE